MLKTIFIGGITRSGGSLLARLFDGHPNVLSYPVEVPFPHNKSFYPIFESYAGIPMTVPAYNGSPETDVFTLLDIPKRRPGVILEYGKEQADPVGVRKNYLEKMYYGSMKTDFNYDIFIKKFDEYRKGATTVAGLYDARHRAYFEAWDGGRYIKEPEFVVIHESGGLYLTNVDTFFKEFSGSVYIHPVRDIMGYIASEKTRLARRYYGSRRFSYPPFPNILVKTFRKYDLSAQIRSWIVAITRAVLLQEKFGVKGRFVVYTYEDLVRDTESTMRGLCGKIGLRYDEILLQPTIAGKMWTGNSHQGRQKGVNRNLADYYPKVLRKDEIDFIEKKTRIVREYIREQSAVPFDLTGLPKNVLPDYGYQKKYFEDEEKSSLYYALLNTGKRRTMIKTPDITAIPAFFYSKIVKLLHVPRMLKLKYAPGLGKQNYT